MIWLLSFKEQKSSYCGWLFSQGGERRCEILTLSIKCDSLFTLEMLLWTTNYPSFTLIVALCLVQYFSKQRTETCQIHDVMSNIIIHRNEINASWDIRPEWKKTGCIQPGARYKILMLWWLRDPDIFRFLVEGHLVRVMFFGVRRNIKDVIYSAIIFS